jgi:hypothetical protein
MSKLDKLSNRQIQRAGSRQINRQSVPVQSSAGPSLRIPGFLGAIADGLRGPERRSGAPNSRRLSSA